MPKPDGHDKLKLTAASGSRTVSITIEKPDWFINNLTVSETRKVQLIDFSNKRPLQGKLNTRTAKAGETLYLVQDNSGGVVLEDRKLNYNFKTNIGKNWSKNYLTHHNYNTGYELNLSGADPSIFNEKEIKGGYSTTYSKQYDEVPGSHGLNINALGYEKSVKVQLVPFDKSEDESVIPAELLTNIRKLRTAIKDAEKLKAKFDNIMGEKSAFKKDGDGGFALVANGQRYNEEDGESNNYFKSKEYEVKLVGSLAYKLSYGPTKFLPNALKKYVSVEIYLKPSLDLELVKSAKWQQKNGVGNEIIDKGGSGTKLQLVGGMALGAVVDLNLKEAIKLEIDANGKAEIEGSIGKAYSGEVPIIVTAKPLVLNFSASVSIADVSILQYNYIKNLTNEITIYDSTKK